MLYKKFIALAFAASFTISAGAADYKDYSRDKGLVAELSVGAPASFELGLGYQFNPHLEVTAEAFSYSGLTAMTGAVSAKYYMLDREITPSAQARLGYGVLGVNYEFKDYYDILGSVALGLSWRAFDLGAGIIIDPFHKIEFNASISWAYRFGRK